MRVAPPKYDLLGKQFGFWTVLGFVGRDGRRNRLWRCQCICGKIKDVGGQHLRYGASKSCGCKSAGLRGVKGEDHYMWKGGRKNQGSLAWCMSRLGSLKSGQKRPNGGVEIVSTAEDVLRLWEESKGVCVACGRKPESKRQIHLDHNKETGVVRGFVCDTCNVAIGMAGHSPERLRAMADYLERTKDGAVRPA